MLTRAPGPAWVNGCVCADPHDGQGGRAGPACAALVAGPGASPVT
jgi:hypothetical protein